MLSTHRAPMSATELLAEFVRAARPVRLTVHRKVWAYLIVESHRFTTLPSPFPDRWTFHGLPIGPRPESHA